MSDRETPHESARTVLDEFEGLSRALAAACPALAKSLAGLVEHHPCLRLYRPLHEGLRLFVAAPGITPLFKTFSYENADIALVPNEAARRGEEHFRATSGLGYDPEHLDAYIRQLLLRMEDRRLDAVTHASVCKAYGFFLRALGFAMARWDEKESAIKLGEQKNVRRLTAKCANQPVAEKREAPAQVINFAQARRRRQESIVPLAPGDSDAV